MNKNGFILNGNFFDCKNNKNIDFKHIEAVVIDPSCSGSGMLNNMNYDEI